MSEKDLTPIQANKCILDELSQEIRTPINSIMGMNELILRDSHSALNNPGIDRAGTREILSAINEYAKNIEDAGNKLLTLINELLSLQGALATGLSDILGDDAADDTDADSDSDSSSSMGATILIVDDTPMHLLVTKGLLKNTNVKIESAESGGVAISMACRKRYDLILMDQRMPGMDGVTAMHYIRNDRNGLNRETPFICLTADAVSGAKERYIAEGFDDYLSKPIDGEELERTLAKHLKTTRKADHTKSSSPISS
ncbi:MAG: response regulator [Lachnospiraceae bacterium]|nr:response regulator [Lachnospiraceae bacterium]